MAWGGSERVALFHAEVFCRHAAACGCLGERERREFKAKNRKVKRHAASQAAGDDDEQVKGTDARQMKRASNQEAGDKAEQVKDTEARQRMRAANQDAGDKAEQGKDTKARQWPP